MSKCGSCGKVVTTTRFNTGTCRAIGGAEYKTVVHSCPFCSAIFSVEIDPLAVRTEIVSQVLKALGKSPSRF